MAHKTRLKPVRSILTPQSPPRQKRAASKSTRKTLADLFCAQLAERKQSLYWQRIYILAKNKHEEEQPAQNEASEAKSAEVKDFKEIFEKELVRIYKECEAASFVKDKGSGLFLYMGDYTILVLEATEDNVGSMCKKLSEIVDNFFEAHRIFLIEDRIDSAHFSKLICLRAMVINITEKFPIETTTDAKLMAKQHCAIVKKLRKLCKSFKETELNQFESSKSSHQVLPPLDTIENSLPPSVFDDLIPDVQRIELVLRCPDFYTDLKQHARTYDQYPYLEEEDLHDWPIQSSNFGMVFTENCPQETNLTLTEYAQGVHKEEEKTADCDSNMQSKGGAKQSEEVAQDKKVCSKAQPCEETAEESQ